MKQHKKPTTNKMKEDEYKIEKPEKFDDLLVKTPDPEEHLPEDKGLEDLPENQPASIRTHDHDGENSVPVKLRNLEGFFEVVSVVPSHKPRNAYDQIKLYHNGGTIRIYWYDYIAKTWRNIS